MSQDRCNAYVAYRLACVRERIQETERLMRPPTPEELLRLQKVLQRLHEQEAQLTCILARTQPRGDVIPEPEAVSSSSATLQRRFFL
jgi:hypothetical protein